jgi:SAM-dependent methyltransferase
MGALNPTSESNFGARNLDATDARPLGRPSFRPSDIWKAPLHTLPFQDEVVYQYLPLSPEMDVLEIGPGSGFTAFRLARRVRHMMLLDIAEANIERLQENVKSVPNLTFFSADACTPGLAQLVRSQFDAIFALQTFNAAMGGCLGNLATVLRPGGHLLRQFSNHQPSIPPFNTSFRTRDELDKLLHEAGFRSWDLYALRLRPLARAMYRAYSFLQRFGPPPHTPGSQERAITYERSRLFRNQGRLARYKIVFHIAWAVLFASLRLGGDCFERLPLGADILNQNLLLLAHR